MGEVAKLNGRLCLLVVFLALSPWQTAMGDEYLDALSAEAHRLDDDQQDQISQTPVETLQPRPARPGYFAEGLSFEQFSSDLRAQFFGTYTFFKRLNNNAQHEVYKDYQGNSEIKFVRETVMQRFLNR